MNSAVADFARDGFVGPVPLLTPDECRAILTQFERDEAPPGEIWPKGRPLGDWRLSRLASDSRLTNLLRPLLGENIVLWGASIARRTPEMLHPWHVDIESSAPDGRFVTLWIGLENTSHGSGLRLIAGSHRGRTIQQVRAEKGSSRQEHSNDAVLDWARDEHPDAHVVQPEVRDGDAILFDGRIWHGSYNSSNQTRTALLLQFAAADSPVRIPDGLDWPFKFRDEPLPPVVVVHGEAAGTPNRVIRPTPPPSPAVPALRSSIASLNLPLAEAPEGGWRRFPFFRGSTAALDSMSCHAAVLGAGHSPHPPHAHGDEELLMVIDGEADLLVAERPDYEGARALRVTPGDFAYYPAGQHHTIRNPSTSPVSYLMFRWRSGVETAAAKRLQPTLFRAPAPVEPRAGKGFATRPVVSGPTRWLRKLHCHVSRLEPGAGYAPHVDPYDVAIVIQSGRVRTLGREVGPGGLIYCAAGEMHGMRNVGTEPAHYIVFEFHGRPVTAPALPRDGQAHARPLAIA